MRPHRFLLWLTSRVEVSKNEPVSSGSPLTSNTYETTLKVYATPELRAIRKSISNIRECHSDRNALGTNSLMAISCTSVARTNEALAYAWRTTVLAEVA
jgi:hypothetical protein